MVELRDKQVPERGNVAVATVVVDGQTFTGRVYHRRANGWPCIETDDGQIASGPEIVRAGHDGIPL